MILGPSLSAVSGISTHIQILLSSELQHRFELSHFQCGSEGLGQNYVTRLARAIKGPFQFMAVLFTQKPDIVHINSAMYRLAFCRDSVFLLLARMMRVATVFQFHGGNPQLQTRVAKLFIRAVLSLSSSIVVITKKDQRFYSTLVGEDAVFRIENGVPIDSKDSVLTNRFRGELVRLAHIGRLVKPKGLLDVIDALCLLKKQKNSDLGFSLDVAGSGPLLDEARQAVARGGLESVVRFLGPISGSSMSELLSRTDLLVLPTYWSERLPYAMLEAMAAGVPLVICQKGAIADVVTDQVEGVFVEPRNPAAIAKVLTDLSGDTERLDRMSLACRKRVFEHYSARRMADDFAKLYSTIAPSR
ncbi:MAG: glycosyltransferase family 4 protein [Woeseiaceae bacterium]